MKKKSLVKKLVSKVLVPATRQYLRKKRRLFFGGLTLEVPPGVFHPGLFFSTTTFLHFLQKQSLAALNILEIGCGSGALSLVMQKAGAHVTAADINEAAVQCTRDNALRNHLSPEIILSDLFTNIPPRAFDIIINNPPFYPGNPETAEDHAWYAGEGYEYFDRLFSEAKTYLKKNGKLWLVISEECDEVAINALAAKHQWTSEVVYTRQTFMEKNFIVQYLF